MTSDTMPEPNDKKDNRIYKCGNSGFLKTVTILTIRQTT
jgi:hypothetical protein